MASACSAGSRAAELRPGHRSVAGAAEVHVLDAQVNQHVGGPRGDGPAAVMIGQRLETIASPPRSPVPANISCAARSSFSASACRPSWARACPRRNATWPRDALPPHPRTWCLAAGLVHPEYVHLGGHCGDWVRVQPRPSTRTGGWATARPWQPGWRRAGSPLPAGSGRAARCGRGLSTATTYIDGPRARGRSLRQSLRLPWPSPDSQYIRPGPEPIFARTELLGAGTRPLLALGAAARPGTPAAVTAAIWVRPPPRRPRIRSGPATVVSPRCGS
jgi:hypothetical protein